MICEGSRHALNGTIIVPGSKSHTIRAVLLAAMAHGTSVINNPLVSEDCLSALNASCAFGAQVVQEKTKWIVTGTGGKLSTPENVIDCGNSGTTTNFVMSMAALCNGYTVITGDYQIRRRPVIELVNALNELHAEVFFTRQNTESPPVIIKGCVTGGTAHFSGFNSQVVSSVLLASPLIQNSTCIRVKEPLEKPYIQMTIDWMKKYGVTLKNMSGDYTMFEVSGGVYHAIESKVPSDWSGVAFPLVAAVCTPSHLVISGLDFNDAQGDKIVVDHLLAMGAHIHKNVEEGTLTVHGGKPLKGGLTINLNDIPDSLPALCVASCFAEGDTTFTGLAHVRVKETDRVAVMQTELARLGARVSVTSESMTVHGGVPLKGARVESHNDHRVAMALTAASLFCDGVVQIKDAQCTSVSFPHFFELMNSVGASLTLVE